MQPSAVLAPTPMAGPPPETDRAVDDLGVAVSGLLLAWRCLTRRGSESSRARLSALEMTHLMGPDEHRLSELAELRNVDQSVISRQIGELEAQGLVCRRPDPADRRASLVRLTPDGLVLLEQARELRRTWLRDALARTPTLEVRTAVELITALTTELAAHAGDIGPPAPEPPALPRKHVTKGTAAP